MTSIERWVALRIQIRNTTFVKELLYPADETPYLPPSLPLQAYAGVYSHPGYGEWPITYHDDTLWNKMNHTNVLRYDAQLDHITGEQFLLIGYDVGLPDDPMYIRVEFDIDGKGAVQQMGLELEYTMKGQKIWFQKVGQRPQPGGSGVLEWSFWYWVAFSAGIVLWEVLCRFWEQILWCFV